MKNVFVLCTGNSCRSQIAHGYLELFTKGKAKIYSAGVETHDVNPKAIATMKEDSVDISHHTSNHVDEYKDIKFDLIITVCDNAKENCPYIPGNAKRFHHNFKDPSTVKGTEEQIMTEFKRMRDEIKKYCKEFVAENI